jgi:glycosyltransferase involved in cell wall biosynthesis
MSIVPAARSIEVPSARRVLIVVSSYAPAMIADMHRARHLAWELGKVGWKVEILAPALSYQVPSTIESNSGSFFPPVGTTIYVPPFLPRLFLRLGMRTIGWRALVPMFFAGNRILRQGIDVVYFSTTQFSLFVLGPLWRFRFGIPYVLDLHDPCVREDKARPVWMSSNFKYSVTRWLLKRIEAVTTRCASGLVAVSPQYLELLSRRYRDRSPEWIKPKRAAVIPFAALDHDLRETANGRLPTAGGTAARIIYVGAGGPIMARSFGLLCKALAIIRDQDPDRLADTRIELYGTILGWEKNGGHKDLAEIATQAGLSSIVNENPARVSYRRSLELLLDADGALILGVDDAGYMPSKLFSYALSGKPLLGILRRDGPAYRTFHDNPWLGEAIWFDMSGTMPLGSAALVVSKFLAQCRERRNFDRRALLEPFLAPAMARRHAELFEACIKGH